MFNVWGGSKGTKSYKLNTLHCIRVSYFQCDPMIRYNIYTIKYLYKMWGVYSLLWHTVQFSQKALGRHISEVSRLTIHIRGLTMSWGWAPEISSAGGRQVSLVWSSQDWTFRLSFWVSCLEVNQAGLISSLGWRCQHQTVGVFSSGRGGETGQSTKVYLVKKTPKNKNNKKIYSIQSAQDLQV